MYFGIIVEDRKAFRTTFVYSIVYTTVNKLATQLPHSSYAPENTHLARGSWLQTTRLPLSDMVEDEARDDEDDDDDEEEEDLEEEEVEEDLVRFADEGPFLLLPLAEAVPEEGAFAGCSPVAPTAGEPSGASPVAPTPSPASPASIPACCLRAKSPRLELLGRPGL